MKLQIELTEEQIQQILKEGTSNPLYEHLINNYPEYRPISTIEGMYKGEGVTGYFINDECEVDFGTAYDLQEVNGVAPQATHVYRTIAEYKILQLIKANGLEGDRFYISYDISNCTVVLVEEVAFRGFHLRLNGTNEACKKFLVDYKELISEYFKEF